jgi:hypothetical protein
MSLWQASPFWWTLAAALEDFRPGAAERVLPAHRLATAVGEIGRVRYRRHGSSPRRGPMSWGRGCGACWRRVRGVLVA